MSTTEPTYVRAPLRRRLEEATQLEVERLTEVLKVKLSLGGASPQSRLEVAFFDAINGALPDVLAPAPTYGAAVATAVMVLTEPGGAAAGVARLVVDAVKKLIGDTAADARVHEADDERLALLECQVLDGVRQQLAASGNTAGLDALKLAAAAPWLALMPGLSLSGMFAHRRLVRLVKAVVLTAAIAERVRLERELQGDHGRNAA